MKPLLSSISNITKGHPSSGEEMRVRLLKTFILYFILLAAMQSGYSQPISKKRVQLVTLDPGHFHAALVQKIMYDDVDTVVRVYAPAGNDLQLHLDKINAYNTRNENLWCPPKFGQIVKVYKNTLISENGSQNKPSQIHGRI